MDLFLASVGWWNFAGSFFMLALLHEPLGQKVLVDSRIFTEDFVLGYWGKLWLFWAAGLNIFFGLINIRAAKWELDEVKVFLIWSDLTAYILFFSLAVWGLKSRKCGPGIYSVFVVFSVWLT